MEPITGYIRKLGYRAIGPFVADHCLKKILKLITYMETPYGDLWYAVRKPDGFRFGSVNRPSPPLSIYWLLIIMQRRGGYVSLSTVHPRAHICLSR